MKTVRILGVDISQVAMEEVLEEVRKWLEKGVKKRFVITPNPEILMLAQKDPELKKILNQADLAVADGVGVVWAAKFLGKPLKERVTGVDLMESLCKMAQKNGYTIGLIGGGPGVAVKTAECLRKKHPGLRIVLAQEEWPHKLLKSPKLLIDLLFVAFGAPKQEKWISENLPELPVKVAMGVGGAFDYLSGQIRRAPKWVQNLGLEWLYRLIRQPWRLRRQMILLKFVWLVLKERFCQED